MYGEADRREPIERGRKLYDAAKALGGTVEFVSYPNTDHGFAQNFGTHAADDAFKAHGRLHGEASQERRLTP